MVTTSVSGHIQEIDFDDGAKKWGSVSNSSLLETGTTKMSKYVKGEFDDLKIELENRAKTVQYLVLWLDCDREGEAIAEEVASICLAKNRGLKVFRAHFSTVLMQEISKALRTLTPINKHMVDAVNARQEIDLRLGAAFTRFMTSRYQRKYGFQNVISYGPCQFPTLG